MHPSTHTTATIGGFIGGGSGGIGSCTWGVLRDLGNIIRLRVVTCEAEPQVHEFTGEELHRVSHAYGTNGVITEIEMPLAPACDWVDVFVAFPDFPSAAAWGWDFGRQDGCLKKLVSVFEPPTMKAFFPRVAPHIGETEAMAAVMVAPQSMDGFLTHLARHPGGRVIYRSDQARWPREPGPAFEYSWNHTTLRALKVDPAITYLQALYAGPDALEKIEHIRGRFPGELIQHLELMKDHGALVYAGLTMVRFTSEARLDAIVAAHEAAGVYIFNPHRYTLEEGGRQSADPAQLAFKRQADPKGLLNPGKMIAWDRPDWDYAQMYAYAGMRRP